MTTAAERAARVNAARLARFGEPIRYRGDKGRAPETVEAKAILDRASMAQSSTPGYFGEIEIDPAVIAKPQKGDRVEWADGVEYVVARIVRPPYGLTRLEIHRKEDPAEFNE